MTKQTVTITDNATGKQVELDLLSPTIGPKAIDIRKLHKELGYFTYDPGFMATASCSSKITYLDGDQGTLLYRGYPIEQLAEHSTFLEVCYLLLNGELPKAGEMEDFEHVRIGQQRLEARRVVTRAVELDDMGVAVAGGELDQAKLVAARQKPQRLGVHRNGWSKVDRGGQVAPIKLYGHGCL